MNRKQIYYSLNEKLSYLSNDDIKNIIKTNKIEKFPKYGINKIYTHDKTKIFIKAIPVAKLFIENQFNTSNLYNLPAYYNYGMGSAGINPWRELLLHIKTTGFVLNNEFDQFPLLYHYRIIEDDDNRNIFSGVKFVKDWWGDNEKIKTYLQDRSKAKHKIVLFLEFIPNVAYHYVEKNHNFAKNFYEQSNNIIKFLHKNGIMHNDGHLGNYIIDDKEKVYITDFGLSLDVSFDLDSREKKFMKMNKTLDDYYKYNNVLYGIIDRCFNNKKIGKELEKLDSIKMYQYIIDNIDNLEIKISKFESDFIKKNKKLLIDYITWLKNFRKSKNKNNYFINQI